MEKLTIGIDVDLTIVDAAFQRWGWVNYLNNVSHHYHDIEEFKSMSSICYNLGFYYPDLNEQEVMAFWKSEIYNNLEPYKEAVEVINSWAQAGHNICFISICKQDHFRNKVEFLKKHFNIPTEQFGFIATKQKGFVDVDVMIDDRLSNLKQFNHKPEVAKILFETPFDQELNESEVSLDLKTKDWYKIGKFVEGLV